MKKPSTNSNTKHSVALRNKTANEYIAEKRAKGELKQISFNVSSELFNAIADYRKENNMSYSDIMKELLEIKKNNKK